MYIYLIFTFYDSHQFRIRYERPKGHVFIRNLCQNENTMLYLLISVQVLQWKWRSAAKGGLSDNLPLGGRFATDDDITTYSTFESFYSTVLNPWSPTSLHRGRNTDWPRRSIVYGGVPSLKLDDNILDQDIYLSGPSDSTPSVSNNLLLPVVSDTYTHTTPVPLHSLPRYSDVWFNVLYTSLHHDSFYQLF